MKRLIFILSALTFFNYAFAASKAFSEIPTNWRVESYGANSVVLWRTPSTCANGLISLPVEPTITETTRLYATVVAAKASGAKVFIQYNEAAGICAITSFGLD